jgi:hypothetical protein
MSVTPYGFASAQVRSFAPVEDDGVIPQSVVAVATEDFVLLDGQPVVPAVWAEAVGEVTAEGLYYVERPSILDIHSDAMVRFVATEETFDTVSYVWSPLASEMVSRYQLDGSPLSAPVLGESRYQIGREIFTPGHLDFAGAVLTSDFNDGFDDAFSFTIAMALNLSDTGYNLVTFLDGSFVSVVDGGLLAEVDGHRFGVDIPQGPAAATPLYVVLDVTPPVATLIGATGPAKIFRGSSAVSARTTSFVFTLTGEMELFSLDVWGDEKPGVAEIVARYASVLGAS